MYGGHNTKWGGEGRSAGGKGGGGSGDSPKQKKSTASPPKTSRGFAGLPSNNNKQSGSLVTLKSPIAPLVLAPSEYPTCIACDKAVYPLDRQVNLDKAIYHSMCAKCCECGCQITVSNFTTNRMNTDLMCRTHYTRKFAASGGILELYQPTPAFIRLLEQKHKTQKDIAIAHKALLERQRRELEEKNKKEVDQTSVIYAVDGGVFDINEILRTIPIAPSSGEASFAHSLECLESVYGASLEPASSVDDPRMYRTLSRVKAYDM